MEILNDKETFENIIDACWDYYQRTDMDRLEIESLERRVAGIKISLSNLLRAVEDGMPYEVAKPRMEELSAEKEDLEYQISQKELASSIRLTREHIEYFLLQFRDSNITDRNCAKRLIDTFINRIWLDDENITLALNYSSDNNVRICTLESSLAHSVRTNKITVYKNVILIIEKI